MIIDKTEKQIIQMDKLDKLFKEAVSILKEWNEAKETNKTRYVSRDLIKKIWKKLGYGEYKIDNERGFIIQMLIQAALPTTPPQETWDLIEVLEKKLERSRESTEHLVNQVRQTLEKEKDYELWV